VIRREDIERAAAMRAEAPVKEPRSSLDRPARLRQTIGAAMARSKREIPHVYLTTPLDLRLALAWLSRANDARPIADRMLPVVLLIRAVALALERHPQLNGYWKDGGFQPGTGIHVGSAIALRGGGLVAPAVRDANLKPAGDVMRELRDLVTRARAGTLRSSELSDPTITVTSLGDEGVETVMGVIYPPQVAIVAFGAVTERPALLDGTWQAVPFVNATLSVDHRAVDGRRGAQFLATVGRLLQKPEAL
jgi:pyruvate dehydrogenase E2 component (dihydrolipoamide acetyltransferase)